MINVVDPLANSCSKLEETSSRWSDDAKQSGNDTYSCANDLSRDREDREHSSECVSQLRDLLLGRPKLVGEVLKRISNCHQLLRLERLEHVTKRLRNRLKDLAKTLPERCEGLESLSASPEVNPTLKEIVSHVRHVVDHWADGVVYSCK